ncbi:hypothetical protein VNO78_00425 [Psophocarpus tetragonolobus]|uniref:Uncharacterized protein n=1 Tax=Psophocarpus tetragonolobus TaxID=3891 RepID=A0AAN9SYF3_PSOTE
MLGIACLYGVKIFAHDYHCGLHLMNFNAIQHVMSYVIYWTTRQAPLHSYAPDKGMNPFCLLRNLTMVSLRRFSLVSIFIFHTTYDISSSFEIMSLCSITSSTAPPSKTVVHTSARII